MNQPSISESTHTDYIAALKAEGRKVHKEMLHAAREWGCAMARHDWDDAAVCHIRTKAARDRLSRILDELEGERVMELSSIEDMKRPTQLSGSFHGP